MKTSVSLALLSVVLSANAYEPDRAKANFAHEAAECSAYFLFVSAAPGRRPTALAGLVG